MFEEASSPFVLCVDSHVLIAPGALSKLIVFFELQPEARDLLQGPLIYDDLRNIATHFEPRWRAGMYGTWASDPRGADPSGAVLRYSDARAWPVCLRARGVAGFNPKFRGFGGEEGYIHEKIRQRGGRTLCLRSCDGPIGSTVRSAPVREPVGRPDAQLSHRFTELGLDTADMEAHFAELLGAETAQRIYAEIRQEPGLVREPEPAG